MAWQKGQSGNPKGSKPEKLIRDAISVALHAEETNDKGKKVKRLRLVAEALVKQAIKGDVAAIKEIADRMDGKVQQDIGVEATDSALAVFYAAIVGQQRAMPDDHDESPTLQ